MSCYSGKVSNSTGGTCKRAASLTQAEQSFPYYVKEYFDPSKSLQGKAEELSDKTSAEDSDGLGFTAFV